MGRLSIDTETTGLEPAEGARPFIVGMAYEDGTTRSWDWPVDPVSREVAYRAEDLAEIRAVMEDPDVTKVFHNAIFDINMMAHIGIGCRGPVHDSMLLAHVVGGGGMPLGLKPLAEALCDFPEDDLDALKKSVRHAHRNTSAHLRREVAEDYFLGDRALAREYCENDCQRTLLVFAALQEELDRFPELREPYSIELQLIPVLVAMQQCGVHCEVERVRKLRAEYQGKIKTLMATLPEGLLPTSTKQIAAELKRRGHALPRTEKGNPSVGAEVLEALAHKEPLARTILDLRTAKQMDGTFLAGLEVLGSSGTLHPHLNPTGARTGRFSCTRPNLQNPPRGDTVRSCVGPRPGCGWYMPDYSQLQVWIFAFLSGEKELQAALLSGEDIHGYISEAVFGTREKEKRNFAKQAVFARLFGGGANRLSCVLGIDRSDAQEVLNNFNERFPGCERWIQEVSYRAGKYGEVKSVFNRRYAVTPGQEYRAVNYLVQGVEADIAKRAMIRISRMLAAEYPTAHLVFMVHDELIVEAPAPRSESLEAAVIREMQMDSDRIGLPAGALLPVSAKYTETNWSEAA